MVAEILRESGPETFRRNIVWRIQALPVIRADRTWLRTVMEGLIANAIKLAALRAESQIEIGWLEEIKYETVIFIQENDRGFDAAYAGKLFKVFQRQPSISELEELQAGPADVQRVIKRQGGRTWTTGVVDKGSTFYFSIPCVRQLT